MPDDLRKARSVVNAIIETLGANVADLENAPEVRQDSPQDALHRLQAQIFILTDALAEVANLLQRLLDNPPEPQRRARRSSH